MVCKDERLKYQLSTAPAHPRSYLGPGAGGRLPPPGAGMVNNIDPMLAGVTNQLKDTTIGGGIPPGAGLPPGGLPPGLGGPLGLGGGMVGVPDGVGGLVPGGDSGRNRFLASRRFVGVIKRCLHDCCMPASFAVLTCASECSGARSANSRTSVHSFHCSNFQNPQKALTIWYWNPLGTKAPVNQTHPTGA